MRRLVVAPAIAALALIAPPATAAGPQITDAANDANFLNSQGQPLLEDVGNNHPTPAGSQGYADVLSVEWKSVKTTKKVGRKKVTTVTAFTVTTTFSAAPTPPAQTTVVYRMLGSTPACGFFGVAYYSKPLSDPTTPQSAIRDNCGARPTRLTKIALPVINGSTMTWTVPISAIPKDTKVGVGSALTGLYFTVSEIEDLQGQKIPDQAPLGFGGATGFAYGMIDDARPGEATFRIGS